MLRISAALMFLLILAGTSGLAQTGHGMMRDGHMGRGGGMMDGGMRGLRDLFQEQQQGDQMTMEHRSMMNFAMDVIQDMAIMMRQLSVIMGSLTDAENEASRDKLHRMTGLIKNMSAEMNRISDLIAEGSISGEEIRSIQNKMSRMRQEMWELK